MCFRALFVYRYQAGLYRYRCQTVTVRDWENLVSSATDVCTDALTGCPYEVMLPWHCRIGELQLVPGHPTRGTPFLSAPY